MTEIAYDTVGRVVCLIGPNDPAGVLPPIVGRLAVPDSIADQVRPRMDVFTVIEGVLLHGGEPVEIPAFVPESVSPLQARKALRQAGVLSLITAALESASEETREAWEYATEIRRDNPFVCGVASSVGMTGEQIDDLFRLAATL